MSQEGGGGIAADKASPAQDGSEEGEGGRSVSSGRQISKGPCEQVSQVHLGGLIVGAAPEQGRHEPQPLLCDGRFC